MLDAHALLRDRLVHPDLSEAVADWDEGIGLTEHPAGIELRVPGTIEREQAAAIEEAVWERLHFASHLRYQRLGEFTIGSALHRSESLALDTGFHSRNAGVDPSRATIEGGFAVTATAGGCTVIHYEQYVLPRRVRPLRPLITVYSRWSMRRELRDLERVVALSAAG